MRPRPQNHAHIECTSTSFNSSLVYQRCVFTDSVTVSLHAVSKASVIIRQSAFYLVIQILALHSISTFIQRIFIQLAILLFDIYQLYSCIDMYVSFLGNHSRPLKNNRVSLNPSSLCFLLVPLDGNNTI